MMQMAAIGGFTYFANGLACLRPPLRCFQACPASTEQTHSVALDYQYGIPSGNNNFYGYGFGCADSVPDPARPSLPHARAALGDRCRGCRRAGRLARDDQPPGSGAGHQLSTSHAAAAGQHRPAHQGPACRHGQHPH